VIKVEDSDYKHNRTLLLKHEHDGRDLQLDYAEKTMKYLQQLWGYDVAMETVIDGNPTFLSLAITARHQKIRLSALLKSLPVAKTPAPCDYSSESVAMPLAKDIPALRSLIVNSLDENAVGAKLIAGVIGDSPSQYSKSPALWNAAFETLGMNAIYLPFDVTDARVGELLETLRRSERFMGINVTVPHKVRVIDFLDELDPAAQRIQAANTIVKNPDGKLIGYNTDARDSSIVCCWRSQDKKKHS
jgi:hypothetical protein